VLHKTATKKLCFFAGEEVGFKRYALAAVSEADREKFTRTEL
jgi:hypothetical protein